CARDVDCSRDMFCGGMRLGSHVCVACRRVGKRCHRHQMCCLGSHCEQGNAHKGDAHRNTNLKKTLIITFQVLWSINHGTSSRGGMCVPTNIYHNPGEEGSACLRSSECAAGLCCAHLWSRVCKRVLALGEACSRRARPKGSRGLELFERCDCGPGLACR
uniref:Dickkopf WNT signaling pathway inhibitor 1 n=1 Tax=Petromyzon marinus TaxID=7757 RepID=S4RCF1_PETMA